MFNECWPQKMPPMIASMDRLQMKGNTWNWMFYGPRNYGECTDGPERNVYGP